MNTFLAFVLDRFFDRQGNCWHCPWCERTNASIVVNEPREGCKDKWRCVACRKWGDEYDLLRLVLPGARFPYLRTRADLLRAEYEAGGEDLTPTAIVGSPPFFPRGQQEVTATNWETVAREFADALTPDRRNALALELGLPVEVIAAIPLLGCDSDGRFTFPECDADGRVVGILLRDGGRKAAMQGGKRGLTVPNGWRRQTGPVFVVEGPSDVLAMTAAGLAAIGRPSNTGGVESLSRLFAHEPGDRRVVIVGENDARPSRVNPGKREWPGRDGAERVAHKLAASLGDRVSWALPPAGFKDVRAFLTSPDQDGKEWAARGVELRAHFQRNRR